MQYTGSKTSKLYLAPNITSEVYISKGSSSDPNNFVYDQSFLNVLGNTTFSGDDLGLTSDEGYSLAIYLPAVNETANELLYGKIDIFFHEGAVAGF